MPPGDIDDLAQEVFLRLLRYSDDIAVDNPQGYLFRIAANVANEWRERSRVRKPHDDSWLEELQIESGRRAGKRVRQDARPMNMCRPPSTGCRRGNERFCCYT